LASRFRDAISGDRGCCDFRTSFADAHPGARFAAASFRNDHRVHFWHGPHHPKSKYLAGGGSSDVGGIGRMNILARLIQIRYIPTDTALWRGFHMFDAQCDFAAVVYGADDDPDRLLLDFAEELRRKGFRTAGLVQLDRRHRRSNDRELRTIVLSNGEVVDLAHDWGPNAGRCHIDGRALASLAETVETAIRVGADLVVINRFGNIAWRLGPTTGLGQLPG
jgi:hypothetical protein